MAKKIILSILLLLVLPGFVQATTYYVDATAGNDAWSGTSPSTPWKTISKINSESFNPGDQILFKRGETWREQLTVPSSGNSTDRITFGAYGTGDKPKIYGSTEVSGWTNEGGNLWYTNCASDPLSVWFVNTDKTITWGYKESSKSNLNTEYEWWWDSGNNRIYVYAASNPDSRYTSIEKPARYYCIYANGKNYITIQYLDASFNQPTTAVGYAAIWAHKCDNIIVEYCNAHHTGVLTSVTGDAIKIINSNQATVRYNTCYFAGRRGIALLHTTPSTMDDAVIEYNTVFDCYHSMIDLFETNAPGTFDGAIVRYNHCYNDADYGQGYQKLVNHAILAGGHTGVSSYRITNVKIHNNIAHHMYDSVGIEISGNANGIEIYNNILYGALDGSTEMMHIHVANTAGQPNTNITIKNNIGMDTPSLACLHIPNSSSVIECDNNLWYNSDGSYYAIVDGVGYRASDFTAYQADTGWDTNGLWEDPKLVNPGTLVDTDYQLQSDSPCIDSGTDVGLTQDYEGNTIPQGGAPDIGAYEFASGAPPPPDNCSDGTLYGQCSSSLPLYCNNGVLEDRCSACGCPTNYTCLVNESCRIPIPGDLNNDGVVDISDLIIIATNFGLTSGFDLRADTNSNNEIDIFDIVFVASRFT
ncbi:hypothetical protein AYK26_04100 [Euryarchaeota archaeon SM23-78]|nr:MAG: hypothetical protein AYK26_04100 [Euryarchaeota archaeon SM23-78]